MTVWTEWSKLNDIGEPSLATLLQNLWDLLWNNENWTSFYNIENALSISVVAILVHLRNRLSVLHVVS